MTFPKLIDPGLTASVPFVAVPVPLRETLTVGSDALDVNARVALYAPELIGEKVIERFVLVPGDIVYGKESPLKVNPEPVIAAFEMVRADPPVLEMVRAWDWLLPTVTDPKLTLPGALKKPPATPVPTRFVAVLPLPASVT